MVTNSWLTILKVYFSLVSKSDVGLVAFLGIGERDNFPLTVTQGSSRLLSPSSPTSQSSSFPAVQMGKKERGELSLALNCFRLEVTHIVSTPSE